MRPGLPRRTWFGYRTLIRAGGNSVALELSSYLWDSGLVRAFGIGASRWLVGRRPFFFC